MLGKGDVEIRGSQLDKGDKWKRDGRNQCEASEVVPPGTEGARASSTGEMAGAKVKVLKQLQNSRTPVGWLG